MIDYRRLIHPGCLRRRAVPTTVAGVGAGVHGAGGLPHRLLREQLRRADGRQPQLHARRRALPPHTRRRGLPLVSQAVIMARSAMQLSRTHTASVSLAARWCALCYVRALPPRRCCRPSALAGAGWLGGRGRAERAGASIYHTVWPCADQPADAPVFVGGASLCLPSSHLGTSLQVRSLCALGDGLLALRMPRGLHRPRPPRRGVPSGGLPHDRGGGDPAGHLWGHRRPLRGVLHRQVLPDQALKHEAESSQPCGALKRWRWRRRPRLDHLVHTR
jgi:hypothetical protein